MRSAFALSLLSVTVCILQNAPVLNGLESSKGIATLLIPSTDAIWVSENLSLRTQTADDDDFYATHTDCGYYCHDTYCGGDSSSSERSSDGGDGAGYKCCGATCCDAMTGCCTPDGECMACPPPQTDDMPGGCTHAPVPAPVDDYYYSYADDYYSDDSYSVEPTEMPTMSPTMNMDSDIYLIVGLLLQGVKLSDLSSDQKDALAIIIRNVSAEVTHIDVDHFSIPRLTQLYPFASSNAHPNIRSLAVSTDTIGADYRVSAPLHDVIDGIMASNSSIVLDSDSSLLSLALGLEAALMANGGSTFTDLLDSYIHDNSDLSGALGNGTVGVSTKPTIDASTTAAPTSSPGASASGHKSTSALAWPIILLIVLLVVVFVTVGWCCFQRHRNMNKLNAAAASSAQHSSHNGSTQVVYGDTAVRSNNLSAHATHV
jgi:hypothetical protein